MEIRNSMKTKMQPGFTILAAAWLLGLPSMAVAGPSAKAAAVPPDLLENDDGAARLTLGRVYGKLTQSDLAVLLPAIIKVTEKSAPSDEMFADAKPGGYDACSEAMAHFIRDVRRDLNVPKLPFVIGVLGVGGPTAEYGPDQQRYKATHQNFRDAMAAPARLPEFKGNVAAVLAEKYWDRELTAAKAKENEIKQRAKKLATEGKLTPAEERAALEKMRTEGLTERERQMLEKGISNLEFHYLGSAKTLGGVGKGLAEAMAELNQLKKTN